MRVAVVHNRDKSGVINVFGPQNRERYKRKTVERVAAALEKGGHTVEVFDGNMHVIEQLRLFMPKVIAGDRPGMVFNMAYGIQGVSRYTHLPAMLEMLGVPYVGSNPMAHGLALDKVIAKIVFKNAGLPTPGFWNFATPDDQFEDLRFPVIVKPKMEAVSFGITVVDNEADLRDAVAKIIERFQQHVLVEEFVAGREFAVGLLGNRDPEVLSIVEIDLEGDPHAIQSAGDKLSKPREKICPAELSGEKANELRALVKRAFTSLELYDFARVDVRMDADGNFYLLEINSMASLGSTGTYVHAAQIAGYSYDELVNRILDVAAVRYFGPDYGAESVAETTTEKKAPSFSARVRAYLRTQAPTLETMLRKMVDMRTPVDDVERVSGFGEWLEPQLRHFGFSVRDYPQIEVGNVLHFTNHPDESGDDVLLLGHLDSYTPVGGFVPYREEGNHLFGTGIAEGKGGLAVALGALRALRFARVLRSIKCGLLFTTDDTLSGAHARKIVAELGGRARFVIGLKAADADGGFIVSRSGRATYRLETVYRRAESEVPHDAVLSNLYKCVLALQDLSNPEGGTQVAVRRIDFDAPFGRLPEKAEAVITVRFNRREEAERVDQKIREIVKRRATRGVRLQVFGRVRRPPMVVDGGSRELAEHVLTAAKRLHLQVTGEHRWHSSDICFVPEGVPKVDGLGPVGGNERTDDEYILRGSLVERAAVLAIVMRRLAGGHDG
jgi:D-alanine-D-alanine ligase